MKKKKKIIKNKNAGWRIHPMLNIKKHLSQYRWAYCLIILVILCVINYATLKPNALELSDIVIDSKCNANFTTTNNTDNKLAIDLLLSGHRLPSSGRSGGQVAMGKGSYILNPKEIRKITESMTCTSIVGTIFGNAEITSVKTL